MLLGSLTSLTKPLKKQEKDPLSANLCQKV